MHRTEGANNVGHLFVDGPPGTTVEEDWLNAIQEEIAYSIEQAGITLKTAATETRQQLKTAIDTLANTRIDVADLRRKNALINGDFNIWQRGTSFVAIANADFFADRFRYEKVGAMVHTVSRDTDVPTQIESGHKSNYSLKLDVTTIDAALAVGDYVLISQNIEGYNFAPFVGNTATLSFWVKATKTGIYCVGFENTGVDRSYVAEYTVNVANTWEKKTITITFDYVGGTWDYTNGTGIRMRWALASGTTYHGVAGSWQNGNFFATVNQVNSVDDVANNFWLSQIQFELGDVATPFEYRLIGDELALCQRYYEKSYDSAVLPDAADSNGIITFELVGVPNNDYDLYCPISFIVQKRTGPTINIYDGVGGGSPTVSMTGGSKAGVVALIGDKGCRVGGENGAATTSWLLQFHYTAEAEL